MDTKLTLSMAIDGYTLAAQARRLSPHTIRDYSNTFRRLQNFLPGDPLLDAIDHSMISAFLAGLPVSKKTVLNYHTGLSALWTWCIKMGYCQANPIKLVTPPRPEQTDIIPFTETECRGILQAMTYTKEYARPGKRASRHKLTHADRNAAIILILLDTGVRASELCSLEIHHCDLKNRRILIEDGKGSKSRHIPISARTAQAIWKYLITRKTDPVSWPLIATDRGRHMDRTQLRDLVASAGVRAGVPGVHPHRFRHTFAVSYLRNGGDIFTLQMILGHSSLDMVRHYLALAQSDLDAAHRRASPVENMRL